MTTTLAFDVYGTLVDPSRMAAHLTGELGDRAAGFAALWREKQVEYSFRRGLMQNYAPFAVCTADALEFAARQYQLSFDARRRDELLRLYRHLPAFPDVLPALNALRRTCRLFAFSNGTAEDVAAALSHAGLRDCFEGIVSVDEIRSFKPSPGVYAYARRATGAWSSPLWLVSSNAWDVIGARSAGLDAAWVRRSDKAIYDPWGIEPTAIVRSLTDLPGVIG